MGLSFTIRRQTGPLDKYAWRNGGGLLHGVWPGARTRDSLGSQSLELPPISAAHLFDFTS